MNKEETLCYTNVYLLFSFFGVASLAKEEAFIGTRLADSGPCGHCWVRVYLDSKFLATAQTHFLQRRWCTTDTCFNTPVLAWKMCLLRFQAHTHTHKAETQLSSEECWVSCFCAIDTSPRSMGRSDLSLNQTKEGSKCLMITFYWQGSGGVGWGCGWRHLT